MPTRSITLAFRIIGYIIACMMACMTIEAQPWQPQLNSCTQPVDKVFLLLKKSHCDSKQIVAHAMEGGKYSEFQRLFSVNFYNLF
jgi:hypothetical protein